MSAAPPPLPDGVVALDGELTLFGFPTRTVPIRIRPRSKAWRLGGAARTFAVFGVVAPVVAILPPHAPWALGALGAGAFLARRRWQEDFTIEHLEGECPKCDHLIRVTGVRLRVPHPVTCDGCHHQVTLKVPGGLADVALD